MRKRTRLYGDSACQGYDKEHPTIDDPNRKPKNGELSAEDKARNTGLSRLRVAVEHRIGRTRRFRIVAERYRNPRPTDATKTSIVAGLVNMNAGFAACGPRRTNGDDSLRATAIHTATFATGLMKNLEIPEDRGVPGAGSPLLIRRQIRSRIQRQNTMPSQALPSGHISRGRRPGRWFKTTIATGWVYKSPP